ncbi:MAG: T9SS type A sorting domain-containing protein [candidate division KSB1 bacterium]|nr:T9SS type A sorting domain-containing protein [candidate division KSB1 bacterium]MDZ7300563.1 T9SS type A sorting domain-containing protein [candidate division KSB1 bacterium]MDZ7309701.1 T9SS type A sorting domain-containing protein [candidate division KSB1 bacterium]
MQRESSIYFAAIMMFVLLPMALSAQLVELCQGRSTTVKGGEYNVMNNVWGASTAQCLLVDLDSTYFKVSLSAHNQGSVASYPAIFKGCHWGWCTTKDNPMPLLVKEIESAPFTWIIGTTGVSGTWNAALDIWFDDMKSFSNDYDAEMMIWLDYHGGAGPAGSRQATVTIGGLSWDVYFAAWTSWNYIAYRITSPVDSVNLDLRDFIHDSITRGYLYTPWYMHAIEAGFEIWRDGQGLTTHSFSAEVIKTTSPVNYAPSSFRLQSPPDRGVVDSLKITFKWQQSIDPDLETVEYIFHLLGPGVDTTLAGVMQNSLVFDGRKYLQPNATYTWYVQATDKIDTTASTTQRTFVTPAAVGIDLNHHIPNKFSLHQNYPNPFNASTEIVFEIDMAAQLDLSVFNLIGESVKTLAKGYYQPGEYRAIFDASGLPSGIYYYQLEIPSQSLKRKCLYIK